MTCRLVRRFATPRNDSLLARGLRRRIGLQHASLRQRNADLLHAVDQLHRGRRGQHHAPCRIATAGHRRVRLDIVEPGNAELNPKRLAVEIDVVDENGERLPALRPVDVADGRGLAPPLRRPAAVPVILDSFAISPPPLLRRRDKRPSP